MRSDPAPLRARRRIGALLVAAFLAVAIGISPPAAGTALAAGPLQVEAHATYTLDPEAGRVHVAIDFEVTNVKPSDASFIYFWRDLGYPIQLGATAIRASDRSGALPIPTRTRERYVEATVHLRANLYYRDTASFTIRYDLVGGAPRSESPIRVGKAFATFGVWAWGDPGLSTVEVRTPAGFGSQIEGGPMDSVVATSGQTLRASPTNPDTFFAIISSENRSAYGSTRVSVGDGRAIVVKAWPEDDAWDKSVSDTLRAGMPRLRELIGLDWPVEHDLNLRERFTPALEGYAGVFFTDDQRIDVSEDLDPVVIVHEASHAWFNQALFAERWIYEGLAQEYAWRVQEAVGGDSGDAAERPDKDDPGYVNLAAWTFPEVIRDQATSDHERYGYQAAFWVTHQIVSVAGVGRMRGAFEAAQDDVTAYVGAGTRETVAEADGWRRLLDLVETFDVRNDSAAIEQALKDFVLRGNDIRALSDRRAARDRYRELLAAGDGWLPPWYVRESMGAWRFDLATTAMAEASTVLELRDDVLGAADALDLEADGALKTAYEGTKDGFGAATTIAGDQLEALTAIADARAKVEAQPDLIAGIGLVGETPNVPYEAARVAFEQGRLDEAAASAAIAAAIITAAPGVGQQRLVIGIVAAVVVILFIVLLAVLVRRRREARALALAAASAGAALDPADESADPPSPSSPSIDPAPTEAYATLADPAPAPAALGAAPPDLEGGPAHGGSPADS